MESSKFKFRVNKFYNKLPFNFDFASNGAKRIKNKDQVKEYGPLSTLIDKELKYKKMLEVGCGVGWFSNSVVYHYDMSACGVDLCKKALKQANKIAQLLRITNKVEFKHCDLFEIPYKNKFALVNSLGVLHHTYDCKKAFVNISKFVEDKGYLHVGLYHKYGREPFLNLFKSVIGKVQNDTKIEKTEIQEAFNKYKELNSNLRNEKRLWSWFRDQVLHPFETQHTLKEVFGWIKELNFELVSTSINKFENIDNIDLLFEEEKKYYDISIEKNVKKKEYFPGFFTVLAKKR